MKKRRIIIEYLYRDAANYKLFEKSIIKNPKNLDFHEFEMWVKSRLIDELYFNPCDYGLGKPQFPVYNSDLEHDWCEFISLREEK